MGVTYASVVRYVMLPFFFFFFFYFLNFFFFFFFFLKSRNFLDRFLNCLSFLKYHYNNIYVCTCMYIVHIICILSLVSTTIHTHA